MSAYSEDREVTAWLDGFFHAHPDLIRPHRNVLAEEYLSEHPNADKSRRGVRRAVTVYMINRNQRLISGNGGSNKVWCMVVER